MSSQFLLLPLILTLSPVKKPSLEIRGISVDLRYASLSEERILAFVQKAATCKANMLVWWLQDKLAWRSHPDLVHKEALSPQAWKRIVAKGKSLGIQMVPYVDIYGHGETYLDRPDYAPLSRGEKGYWGEDDIQYCQMDEKGWNLIKDLMDESLTIFDNSPYFHVGMDEVGGQDDHLCPVCREEVRKIKNRLGISDERARNRFIAQRLVRAHDYLKSKGRKVLFWDDAAVDIQTLASGPGGAEILPPDVLPLVWAYGRNLDSARKALSRPQTRNLKTLIAPGSWDAGNIEAYLNLSKEYPQVAGLIVTVWEKDVNRIEDFWPGFSLALALAWDRDADPVLIRQAQAKDEGFLQEWDLTGPFVKRGASLSDLHREPFPPEKSPDSATWKKVPASFSAGGQVDLEGILGGDDRVAYLRSRFDSPAGGAAYLEMGSDDGLKAWLNGVLILDQDIARAYQPGEDKVLVSLKRGENILLLKVSQAKEGWSASARIRRP